MQNKLHQLVILALKRNSATAELQLDISMRGNHVIIRGYIYSDRLAQEVVDTVESVSPYLKVTSELTIAEPAFA